MNDPNSPTIDSTPLLRKLASLKGAGLETRLRMISKWCIENLGDRQAHEREGNLKPGERQFFVSGYFLLTPDKSQNLLVGETGFPKEQHRLRIPADLGHPGWVVERKEPLLLVNTDEHSDFEQILKTSRMGSAIYAPMFIEDRYIGQLICAAQARNTMGERDLNTLVSLAWLSSVVYRAHDGDTWLAEL
jgi:hypothetical protein